MQNPQPENPTPPQLTQQQLKRKRRQKILARANTGSQIVQPQHLNSTQIQKKPNTPTQHETFTAYEIFKASQSYQQTKKYVEWVSIVLGLVAAIFHILSHHGQLVFMIVLSVSCALTLYIQLTRSYRIAKYTNKPAQNQLIQKISNIKQLEIANKVLKVQAALSPITKILASYFLAIVVSGCFWVKG